MGSVENLSLKVWSTLAMLALTIFFCYLPFVLQKQWRKAKDLLSVLNCLAGGVVLGALLMHMIPESVLPHHDANGNCTFQWGCMSAGISFLFLFSIDRMFLSHAHCENESDKHGNHNHSHDHGSLKNDQYALEIPHINHQHHEHGDHCDHHAHHGHDEISLSHQSSSILSQNGPHEDCHEADVMGGCHMEGIRGSKSKLQTYVFVFCLSLHSLLEGLGMSGKRSGNLFKFLIGLFAHKWIEAFALGVTVMGARFTRTESFLLMSFYSLLTPVGIAIGMLADYLSPVRKTLHGSNTLTEVIMNGAATGSFLFVSCIEMIPPEFHTKTQSTPVKFLAVILGFMIMATVATYHSH